MPSCNTYHLTSVSLTLGVGYLFMAPKVQPLLLTLDKGYLLTAALPDLQCGPFRYDLNQIPYDYTVEVRNRFKGLDLIDRMPDEL